MPQSWDVNPIIVSHWARGRMAKSRLSKRDTRKVLRNKHNSFIELRGLYSSRWRWNGKHERQTRILITRRRGCCHLSYLPKQHVFIVLQGRKLRWYIYCSILFIWDGIILKFWTWTFRVCVFKEIKFQIDEVPALQSGLKGILIDIHQPSCTNNNRETMPPREIHHWFNHHFLPFVWWVIHWLCSACHNLGMCHW